MAKTGSVGLAGFSVALVIASLLLVAFATDEAVLTMTRATVFSETQPISIRDYNFSIVQITDTQNISDEWVRGYEDPSITEYFSNLTNWIVANAQEYNIEMVIHTGDIINYPPDSGTQWTVANNCFMPLLENNIPYCWCAGNHDQNPMDDPNGTCSAPQYPAFNVTVLREKSYWVSDIFDAKNTAVQFSFNGYKFLIVNVEYEANSTVISWMRNLLGNNTDANIIVGTHDFIDWNNVPTTDWARAFQTVLDQYPNVFLTLNGHNNENGYPCSSHTQVGNRTEIFFNLQEVYNYTGADTVRIYQFSLSTNTVQALTYQVFSNQWFTNNDYQFTCSFPFLSQQPKWHLITNVNPAGAGTTNPNGATTVYGSINVTAEATADYVFSHWVFDNTTLTANPINLPTQPSGTNHSLTAHFDKTVTLTLTTDRPNYPKWSYVNITALVTGLGHPLGNAAVNITVTDTHNRPVWTENTFTNSGGKASSSYKLVFNAQMGTYQVTAQATHDGYLGKTAQTTFYSLG